MSVFFARRRGRSRTPALLATLVALFLLSLGAAPANAFTGAIFTTDPACDGTNVNIFFSKGDVHLDGGPGHLGAAGLPDGSYYAKVTEPNGTVLGSTTTASVQVVGGSFAVCYQLSAIMTRPDSSPGYDTTSNGGSEYKVWVSPTADFAASKTDNFKVRCDEDPNGENPCDGSGGRGDTATLDVNKFYDANANGVNDDGQPITGWAINIHDGIAFDRFTPVTMILDPDDYVVTEYMPVQSNWIGTTANPVNVTLAADDETTVEFGNLCTGAGGGLTLGYWSNKNGQKLVTAPDLNMLGALNLRNGGGSNYDPASASALSKWLLSATATNMASMLSAQLATMELSVFNGLVAGSALIYAPGTTSANSLGFATVNAVMSEANTSLGANGLTVAAGPVRTYQEALKNALDNANNNKTFVQGTPCAFTFL